MKPNQASYDNFRQRIKSRYKKEKLERKETVRSLREINYVPIVESSPESNDEQAIQRAVQKGNKWWGKINRYYFRRFDLDSLQNYVELTTSEDILDYGGQISPLLPFYQEVLCTTYPAVFLDESLRVIFRYHSTLDQLSLYRLFSFVVVQAIEPKPEIQPLASDSYSFYSFHTEGVQEVTDAVGGEEGQETLGLQLVETCSDSKFIEKALNYEMIWRDNSSTEIEKQLECWLQELEEQHHANMEMWGKIGELIEEEERQYPVREKVENEIEQLRKSLVRGEIYVYFRSGYEDKTLEDLDKVMEYLRENRLDEEEGPALPVKFYETDCKVCFCTKNEFNNPVLYCDECSTSFHYGCYGIEKINSEDSFWCDVCLYAREQGTSHVKMENPSCQICSKSRYPTKKVDGHFYHVSCLVLFNFADVKDFKIKLKPGVTHESIMNLVIEDELQNDFCEFCPKYGSMGMQLRCESSLCAKSYHPICAYLHGCIFFISRSLGGRMNVQVECRQHFQDRKKELFEQVYTRRFFCNHKNTSRMTFSAFEQTYQEQLNRIDKAMKAIPREKGIRKVLKFTKTAGQALDRRMSHSSKKREPSKTETSALIKEFQMKSI